MLNLLCWGLGMIFNFSQTEIWGYLSTANSLLVAIPATRNSFLVWITQLSIDQTIMYHRWLGRLTIVESFIHFFCALNKYSLFPQKSLYGSIALGCLGIIGLTSIEYFRRKAFNFFFYSHHIFFLYYVMGSLHSELFFTYTCVATGIYGLDRIIRWVRGIYPRRVTLVENLTDKIIRVQFPKYKYSKQRVGQYVFLNFPQISLLEWHPFTLANGPNESFQEVYIKNLGNHTEQLLQRVQKDSWVRVDGPYGYWPFNHTLYPHILFVCGGIGITPCLSFIRHIYEYNHPDQPDQLDQPDSPVRHIYLVWCCTQEEEAQWVNQELLHAIHQSQLEKYPNFDLFVFITGSSRALQNSTYHVGRPDMNRVFDTIEEHMLNDDRQLENILVNESKACVFACGPKSLTLQTWDTWSKRTLHKRYDYHQEIFEF
jgi:predicted ferric reductase